MFDSTGRATRLACAAALALGAPAQAQEVHVFSDGKPFAAVDAGNAARGRVKDERKARHRLGERPDAAAIAAAHAAAFLRCGLDESKYPADKPATAGEIDYFVRDATYLPVAGTSKIILLGEYERGKAMIDLDQHAVITPQCPAGVRTMFWSHDTSRVAFATQQVQGVDFHGASRALWTARFDKAQDLYYFDSAHPDAGLRKLMALPSEKVLDMLLPDKAAHVLVLSQRESRDLRSPRKWWRALTGSPATKIDVVLRKVDLQGRTLETVTVATSVASGAAHFVRE